MAEEIILEVKKLSKHFGGIKAVDNVGLNYCKRYCAPVNINILGRLSYRYNNNYSSCG